jgi:riboflavin kinase, archaea type
MIISSEPERLGFELHSHSNFKQEISPQLRSLMRLHGKVVSGMGNFSYWIEKLQEHYARKTGMNLFPGTLNIQLDQPYSLPSTGVTRLDAQEYGGTVS